MTDDAARIAAYQTNLNEAPQQVESALQFARDTGRINAHESRPIEALPRVKSTLEDARGKLSLMLAHESHLTMPVDRKRRVQEIMWRGQDELAEVYNQTMKRRVVEENDPMEKLNRKIELFKRQGDDEMVKMLKKQLLEC